MLKPVPNTQTGSVTDHEHGTNDTLTGVDYADNTLYGDAFEMYDKSHGGDDALTGGDAQLGGPDVENKLYGDASGMHDNARGGDDMLTGGDNLSIGFSIDGGLVIDRDSCNQHPLWRRRLHGRQRPRRQ